MATEAKNHHYIPQSYLRNFAVEKKGERYVYVRFMGKKFHVTNIKNICSETYFYSIQGAPDDKKNVIENFYAENIDILFPEITDIITADEIIEIDYKTRRKIVIAILSLYFRTPKFLKQHTQHLLGVIELLKKYSIGKSEVHTINFLGNKIDVRNVDFEKLQDEVLNQNKNIFLQQHIEIFDKFVEYKIEDGIGIIKTVDDNEFITCDNPVLIRSYGGKFSNDLFEPENMINVPINNKYLLFIHPKSDTRMKNTLTRISGQLINVLTTNLEVERNSEKWIIGSQESMSNHVNDQIRYNALTPENEKMVTDLEIKGQLALEMNEILDRYDYEISQEFIDKLKSLSQHDLFKDDPNIIRFVKIARLKGYNI